ncbi:MAG: LPS export ABC transporter permease LptF [Hydrogenophilales bacterium CG17_big_fil_post_rev_8_21_14_2_50_63_12]|nr:MAG: LPS export ABC transporter permease LptF [Hydrogenophilales bacterium CG17_big_fil_post_rev_8_21_14_2_50_63_12]PIX95566.1 MAG: LPS export ABC transporter permease LptF [Hydrogenophilales bacterium CG_4_10_14_3_um_filter_63_21]
MRLFDRTLIREMAAGSAVAFTALAAIFAVMLLVRVLGRAALGDIANDAVFPLLGFGFARFLPILLSMALFIGVFMSLSRLWRDSEAVIWMNAGLGPFDWMRPVILFSLPALVMITFVSMVLIPWLVGKQTLFEENLASRDRLSTLAPGVFSEDRQGQRVFFVETASPDAQYVGNVFVQSTQQGRMGVIVARQGYVQLKENGDRFLVLERGNRYEGTPGLADFRVANFASYAVRLEPQVVAEQAGGPRTRSLATLFSNPTAENMAEWVWRISYPISTLILCLLAVPLSYVNPRAGRSLNAVFAILIYATYSNFVGLSQGWVARSQLSASASIALVHGAMLAVLALAYWRRFHAPGRA